MSEGHFSASPPPGGPHRKGRHRSRKARKSYPVARPYAPPPGLSAATPPPAPVSSSAPHRTAPGALRTVGIMLGIAATCMAGGWYFYQGPGGAVIKNMAAGARQPASAAEESPAIAKSTPPDLAPPKDPSPASPRQPEKPATEQTPATPRPPEKPQPSGPTFGKDVLPIFQAKCTNCHNEDKKRGGLDVTSLAALMKGGDNGPCIVAGSLDRSNLWGVINTNQMPPTPNKLSAAEKRLIQEWILSGAR